jgi:hypothetical protein
LEELAAGQEGVFELGAVVCGIHAILGLPAGAGNGDWKRG